MYALRIYPDTPTSLVYGGLYRVKVMNDNLTLFNETCMCLAEYVNDSIFDLALVTKNNFPASGNKTWYLCQYYDIVKYDVYYSENKDIDEVAFVHGSVYTVPKVEPKQWRTITTEGTTVTYGDWKLLSQATPQGVEGTNYEYMKEACVVREVVSLNESLLVLTLVNETTTSLKHVTVSIEEIAVPDRIVEPDKSYTVEAAKHKDRVFQKLQAPNVEDVIVSYNHEDGETSTNTVAIKTRRIDRA